MRKGQKHTIETRKRMSLARMGKKPWNTGMKGVVKAWNKGLTKETHPAIRKYAKSGLATRKRLGLFGLKKGKHYPNDSKAKLGEKNPNWRGGLVPKNKKYHNTVQWILWREKVFKRDNWTCRFCKQKGGKLIPHHIVPISINEHKVFFVNNGLTLCKSCHHKYHRELHYGSEEELIKAAKMYVERMIKNDI